MKGDWELPQHLAICMSKTYYNLMVFERRHWLIQLLITPLSHSLISLHLKLGIGRLRCCEQADWHNWSLSAERHCMINSHLHQTLLSSSHFLCPLPLTWNWTLPLCFILSWKQGNTMSYMSIWPLWTRKKLSKVMPCGSIKPIKVTSWILVVLGKENML